MAVIIAAAIAAAGGIAGGAISASGAKKQQQSAMANQKKAFGSAQGYLDALKSGKEGNLSDIFGSKLDPEAFLYHPVDITQSQLDTIQGNLTAFPSALELTNKVNPEIWKNDLNRIRTMMPGYDDSRDLFLGSTKRLLAGQLPFQDVEDVVSNRSSLASMLGTPGGSRNATLRDLGLSRMDAMGRGGSMFQQFIQMAEAISPVSSQMRPQQMFFTPQERLQADILQRSLEQQGNASAAMAEAMPDPAQNALANANIGLNMAALGSSYQPSSGLGMQALGQGIAGAAGLFGSIYGQQRSPSFSNNTAGMGFGLSGSGYSASATPWTGGYYPSSQPQVSGGVAYSQGAGNTLSSFVPTSVPGGSSGATATYGSTVTGMSSALFPNNGGGYVPSYGGVGGGINSMAQRLGGWY